MTSPFNIIKSFPPLDSNQSFTSLKHLNHLLFCTWKREAITVFLQEHDSLSSKLNSFRAKCPVIAVVSCDRNGVICIDSEGNVYKIVCSEDVKNATGNDGHDTFMSPSTSPILGSGRMKEKELVQIEFIEFCKLKDCGEVQSATYSHEMLQLIVVSKMNNRLCLVAYNALMETILVSEVPCNLPEIQPEKTIITACHSKHISAEMKNVLFPALCQPLSTESGVVMVSLSSGLVFWTTSNDTAGSLQLLHKCHQSITSMKFFSLGGSKTFDALCLVLKEGPVLLLYADGAKLSVSTQFLPAAAKAVICKQNGAILSSDFTDCYFSSFQIIEKSFSLNTQSVPVKGVIQFLLPVDDGNIVIAVTKSGSAYKIFINNIKPYEVSERFSMPKKRVLEDCISCSNELDSILKQIEEENDKLAAISLSMRAAMLHQFFNVSMKIYSGSAAAKYGLTCISQDSHSIVIRIENRCSFFEFLSKSWFINVILSTNSDTESRSIHQNTKLKQSFKHNDEIIIHFPLNFTPILSDSQIKVSLVSNPSNENTPSPWLVIPLKIMPVDVLYFFTPLKNPTVHNLDAANSSIDMSLKKFDILQEQNTSKNSQLTYFIKLPEEVLRIQNVFSLVLNYSKYRCKESVWKYLADASKSICFATLIGNLVQLSLEKGCLCTQINHADSEFFHMIKMAIINLLSSLSSDDFVFLKKSFLVSVQGSLQALEIAQISQDCNLDVFLEFRNLLRSTIDVHLPP
ncbi:unnamed protein product [Bemisia tabaci]|uniref:Uncharacterized protein n=1 Tax=Bemisia tabaci TaxID=7038 RepID=A0A9P0F2X2_BEMTA|nr:unnamed protein product [Bemisia tabaci]